MFDPTVSGIGLPWNGKTNLEFDGLTVDVPRHKALAGCFVPPTRAVAEGNNQVASSCRDAGGFGLSPLFEASGERSGSFIVGVVNGRSFEKVAIALLGRPGTAPAQTNP